MGGALLALLLAGLAWVLRKRPHSDDAENEEEPPLLVEETPAALQPTAPLPPLPSSQIRLDFEPERLTMALVNARLSYSLSLTNLSDNAIGPVSIACDIISAHGSLSASEQLLLEDHMVEPKHQFALLAAQETVSLTSELQLPVAAILPVRSGDASLFVPLARFRITALAEGRPPLVSTRIFVIGESPEQPGQRLKPIRIDQGPRTFSRISQREVDAPA